MFVYLSKLLPIFIYPAGMISLLLILCLILHKKKPKTAFWLGLSALLILFICGNRWVANSLAKSLEWRYLPPQTLPTTEVIVVLGGATDSADYPRLMAEVNSAGDRVLAAANLYQQGVAPVLLLSGGNLNFSQARGSTPAEEMRQILALMGIPDSALWLQDQSQNTYEDALYSAAMLKEKGISAVVLVTSAMHMPRAVRLFEHQGISVTPIPVDYTITEQNWGDLWRFNLAELPMRLLPSTSALGLTTEVIKEYLGMLIYSLQGWL